MIPAGERGKRADAATAGALTTLLVGGIERTYHHLELRQQRELEAAREAAIADARATAVERWRTEYRDMRAEFLRCVSGWNEASRRDLDPSAPHVSELVPALELPEPEVLEDLPEPQTVIDYVRQFPEDLAPEEILHPKALEALAAPPPD